MFILRVVVVFALALAAFFGALSFSSERNSETMAEILAVSESVADPQADPQWVLAQVESRNTVLSGLPSFGRLAFQLPIDAGVTSGQVQLAFRSDVPTTANATLRILVNGTRRVEAVLEAGTHERVIRFPLETGDLDRNNLFLGLSLTGSSSNSVCGLDEPASVLQVLPQTHLELKTVYPVSSLLDRFRVGGGVLTLDWMGAQSRQDTLLRAADFMRAGLNVDYALPDQPVFSLEEGTALLPMAALASETEANWPVAITSSSSAGAREFSGKSTWRYRFRLEDMPDGRNPSSLDYAFKLGPIAQSATETNEWLIWVFLNGRLLETLTAPEGEVARKLKLPQEMLLEENTLELSAGLARDVDGICNDGPTLIAELLPSSVLNPGALRDPRHLDVAQVLGGKPVLRDAGFEPIGAPAAAALTGLMAKLPVALQAEAETPSAEVHVQRPDRLSQESKSAFVIYEEDARLRVLPLGEALRSEAVQDNVMVLVAAPSRS